MKTKFSITRAFLYVQFLLLNFNSFSQREFGVCDSTFYTLNSDTTIIVGQRHVWFESNDEITFCADFSINESNFYIRDFDIIKADFWYVLVGSKSIGNETFLYKSTDRGLTWLQDSSFYSVSKYDEGSEAHIFHHSINNVQKINDSTLVLFMGYYNSGIIYSTDLGESWKFWFRTNISHYQGLFECNEDYYLWSYSGDGFQASMFSFPKSALFSPDTGAIVGAWQYGGLYNPACYMGGGFSPPVIGCFYAPLEIATNRCNQYNYFKAVTENNCQNLGFSGILNDFNSISIFPNPFKAELIIEINHSQAIDLIEIRDAFGSLIQTNYFPSQAQKLQLNLENERPGLYFISIYHSDNCSVYKVIKN